MSGRIVILNGAPRSGKSSIAKAMQDHLPGRWINLGVDSQNRSLPEALLPGIGLRPAIASALAQPPQPPAFALLAAS